MGFIIKPLVTEKMTAITDKQNNRFGFVVRPEANKLEIKNEVEALYNVTVVDVNTIKYAGKNKSRYTKAGLINGRTNEHRGKDIKLLVLSKKLLHGYQKSLLYLVRNPQVVATTKVR